VLKFATRTLVFSWGLRGIASRCSFGLKYSRSSAGSVIQLSKRFRFTLRWRKRVPGFPKCDSASAARRQCLPLRMANAAGINQQIIGAS